MMRFLTILISLTFFFSFFANTSLQAQPMEMNHSLCGSVAPVSSITLLEAIREKAQGFVPEKELTTVPVSVHIVRQSNGLGGVTIEQIDAALEALNENFVGAEMEFFYCNVNYIDDNDYFNFWKSNENSLTSSYNIPNTINLYITNNVLTNNGTPICGFTHFPGEVGDHIILAKTCFTNGSSFSHEMGHYLGLYHTHGKTSSGITDELNSGINCLFGGDDVCDTPADPNLLGNILDCNYIGTDLDENGEIYSPDVNNIMSYAPSTCRIQFTEGQLYRAAYILSAERDYLFCGGLSADFVLDQSFSSCGEPLTVNFEHTGTGATLCTWNFGDGDILTTSSATIQHTYDQEGTYTVSLTVQDGVNIVSKSISQLIHVQKTSNTDYFEDFNNGLSDWDIENLDNGNRWQPIFDFAYSGNTIVCMNNFTQNQNGQEDYLKSRNFNLEAWTGGSISFMLSYSPLYFTPDFFLTDELEVQYSIDCGDNYETLYIKSGEELSTTTETNSNRWYPKTEEDWRLEVVDLPAELMGETLHFRIVNRSGQGNYLYIDDFSVNKVNALPVEIKEFSVDNLSKGNLELNWTTSNEINVAYFEIEFSKDNRNWEKVGNIDAYGNSENDVDYSFDYFSLNRENYFRLKMVDNDGSFEYSNIVFTENKEIPQVMTFPNPTVDYLNISSKDFDFQLIDLNGRILLEGSLENDETQQIDLRNFKAGVYFLVSTDKSIGFIKKIIKK